MTSRVESCLLIAITAVSLLSSGAAGANAKCEANMDRGSQCPNGGKAQIAWFYDRDTDVCLAFKYNGCGGNANRFPTASACESSCKTPDSGSCALNKEPAVDRNGQSIICSGPEKNKCPTGYRCKRLAFMGVCCPTKEEERFSKDYEGACSVGQTVKNDRGGWMATLLGKSCADDFCPNGSTCEQGEIFAHCCKH
ncbi:Major allergen Ani s 1 [Toxocara canis]|uniref:Major allergen Ani s 1 n=1 Tax=Toxocara canis TaxID=6265 RepID=A0A0B2V5M2_TOXCA|nr:Major allergen Ani s 1 [Toxocara canis]